MTLPTALQNQGVDVGLPYQQAKPIHIQSYYQSRSQLGDLIAQNAPALTIRAYVEFMASGIPDADKFNECILLLDNSYKEILTELITNNTDREFTSQQLEQAMKSAAQPLKEQAMKSAAMLVSAAIMQIMDDTLGIEKHIMIGVL